MKKTSVLFFVCFLAVAAFGQTKPNKTNVVGKWSIYSLEVPQQLYYNLDKDSLELSKEVKASIDPSQLTMMASVLKQQFAMFGKVTFAFNADGTSEVTTPTGEKEKGTYTVDEEKGTITNTDKGGKEQDILSKVLILDNGNKMELVSNAQNVEIHMVLKKVK